MTDVTDVPIAIVGGGPTGMTLALLLARRQVRSILVDARTVQDAGRDARLLALSRGSLHTLSQTLDRSLPATVPIRRVIISSAGEFGRAMLDESDLDGEPLGATIRYRDLLHPLAEAVAACPLVDVRRPWRVSGVRQAPETIEVIGADGGSIAARVAVNAEGAGGGESELDLDYAVIADVAVERVGDGVAHERFTREGPLALLPVAPVRSNHAAAMALVWCMSAAAATRRRALDDAQFLDELNTALGPRIGCVVAVGERSVYPLRQRVRAELRDHRYVHLGNAAQALHPVAGQGLNLGLRDCVALAQAIGGALETSGDPLDALPAYERARRVDRQSIIALTRATPQLFTTRFAPIALARSAALTALAAVPQLRREFARLMMFGVRG
jgi:2-octaprenyl-6-methoxyphenol hydroxylase